MAGFFLVAPRGAHRGLVALALLAASALTLAAQAPMMQAATQPPAATPAPATTPPGTQPAAGAKPAPIIPPVPVDYFQRYGKILSPGTEASHPLKLAMPNPDVGQIKIPTGEETALRDKIERLTTMSDEDIRKDLANWPAFKQMSLADEGAMLVRIQQFKDHRAKLAQECAHDLGLLTLSPAQMDRFTQEYWQKRLKLDGDLARQFQPIYQARESKMEEELFREYSTPAKPPLTKPVVVKKPATPGVPTTPATPMPAPNPMVADPSVATPAQPMH